MRPWPQEEAEMDNLCTIVKRRNLTATIVMGGNLDYFGRVGRCTKASFGGLPLDVNAAYAEKHGYGLRVYIDEAVPATARCGRATLSTTLHAAPKHHGAKVTALTCAHRHGKNALQGELRKVIAMQDAMRPTGPQFGTWRTKLQTVQPDLVMWVDGDAHIVGKYQEPLTIEEVVRRACSRSEMPGNFARIIAQDSGSNVNAGWYIISARSFGIHFLHYLTELFEVYGPCKMWGQNLIQEALLVVMAGTPPPWPLVLPCSGEKYQCLTNKTLAPILQVCHGDKDCVLTKAAALTNATKYNSLFSAAASLNTCFGQLKMIMAPNAKAMVERAYERIATQGTNCGAETPKCCDGYNTFNTPRCNGGANHSKGWWTASGAGVVLLPEGDASVCFNRLKLHTQFLWHHGHGRLISSACP